MPKLPVVTGKQMLRFLQQQGFMVVRSRGSHFFLRNAGRNLVTTVPVHGKEGLRSGTLLGILDDIQMTKSEFVEKFKK